MTRPLRRRPGGLRPARPQHDWPVARRPSRRSSSCASRRPRSSTSTDLVAVGVLHAAYSRGRDRARRAVGRRATTTSPSPPTRCPPLTTLRMPIAEMVGEGVGSRSSSPATPTGSGRAADRRCSSRRSSSASRRRRRDSTDGPRRAPRRSPDGPIRPVRPRRGRGVPIDARAGIQTRIAPGSRCAQAKYGIAPSSIGVPVAASVAGRVSPSGAVRRCRRAGLTVAAFDRGVELDASSSAPAGRSAVSTQ